jgi:hypothetical protein
MNRIKFAGLKLISAQPLRTPGGLDFTLTETAGSPKARSQGLSNMNRKKISKIPELLGSAFYT